MKIPQIDNEIISYQMYRVEKLKDNVYHIDDMVDNPSSMYCIVGKNKALWIDTSNQHDEYLDELRNIVATICKDKEVIVAITHFHFDHTGANKAFNNCEFYLPRLDFEDDDYGIKIDDGYIFDLGDIKVKTLVVPGHSLGSTVFIVDDLELVVTGDAIGSSFVWLFFMDNVLVHYEKGLKHLYNNIKNYKNPLFMCGHRWQQYPSQNKDPLSPNNDPMTMQYVVDMMALVQKIKDKTAIKRPFYSLDKPEEHAVYSFEGSYAEIDSFNNL